MHTPFSTIFSLALYFSEFSGGREEEERGRGEEEERGREECVCEFTPRVRFTSLKFK